MFLQGVWLFATALLLVWSPICSSHALLVALVIPAGQPLTLSEPQTDDVQFWVPEGMQVNSQNMFLQGVWVFATALLLAWSPICSSHALLAALVIPANEQTFLREPQTGPLAAA